ncbi:type II secretion system GspH family protein [Rugamonas sp. A1-17]|nr:type II secretion system GspH family protein [Rugamonas sp. A1-17]
MMWRRQAGFSLIELLASAAILGLLASVAVPVVETSIRREKERALRIALREMREGIDAYKRAAMAGMIDTSNAPNGYPPSLIELVGGVVDKRDNNPNVNERKRFYFMRRIPRNPFCTTPSLSAMDCWAQRSFASPPTAPLAGNDVFDVYADTDQVGLNGVPYREW